MSGSLDHQDLVEDARARLDRADRADDDARARLLDDLYARLEAELDADQAPSSGR